MKPEVTINRIYLRSQRRLSGEDLRQLEDFLAHLRRFYDIPDDEPVFPPRKEERSQHAKPSRHARNAADHPWRRS